MKIDGKIIANSILTDLTGDVKKLKQKRVNPTLVVILVGDNPSSISYIKQKGKASEQIGAKLELCHLSSITRDRKLHEIIEKYNNDTNIHGIIVQRPLPKHLENSSIYRYIKEKKDVDGFVPGSLFEVPVAKAVLVLLDNIFNSLRINPTYKIDPFQKANFSNEFHIWLLRKSIVVIGRGETAGKPIANLLIKKGYNVSAIHSKTKNPDQIIRKSDIVISCVGKDNIVRRDNIKNGVILLSAGIWRDNEGKLHGDYDEEKVSDIASFYTPTPGGVGPINVACLMQNLVLATQKSS